MFSYNDNYSLGKYPEEMIDILLELYNKIKEKFMSINNNTEILSVDDSLDHTDLMMDSLNKLADMLEMHPLFENEYYLSLSIINDIEFIVLDNKELLKENLPFIAKILINFCRLISDKLDLILANRIIDYQKEYDEFLTSYNNQQENFYNNLPEINEDYDDAIDKITNILWWWKLKTINALIGFIYKLDEHNADSKSILFIPC